MLTATSMLEVTGGETEVPAEEVARNDGPDSHGPEMDARVAAETAFSNVLRIWGRCRWSSRDTASVSRRAAPVLIARMSGMSSERSRMTTLRRWLLFLVFPVGALSQDPTAAATILAGVPLRVALERKVRMQRTDEPVQGRLVEPVYVFDRVVLPAGSLVEGHIAEIGGVRAGTRIRALLAGNFTPRRDVRARFDTLVLGDGTRLSLHTRFRGGRRTPVV
jgi:hypothetical protein